MLNSRDLVVLLFLSSSTLLATTLVFLGLWIRARERAIRATLESPRLVEHTSPDLQHLVHVCLSVGAAFQFILFEQA